MELPILSGARKLPEFLQTEASECGLTCLAMVASFHGHHVQLPELRHRFPTSLKGSTLSQICEIAEGMRLMPRALPAAILLACIGPRIPRDPFSDVVSMDNR